MHQKDADALCAMAEHYIAGGKDEELKTLAGNERCQVVLHLDVETLKKDHEQGCGCDHEHMPPHLDKQWITMKNAKRFSCDASLLTVLEDKDGNVLNIGRKARTVPPALKRALDVRDETCRFPGCCESHYVDFHHIKHWANGGETSKGNLVKLCRFHHRLLHDGVYDIEAIGDKNNPEFVFRAADGKVIERNPPPPKNEDTTVEGTTAYFKRRWPDIDAETVKSMWTGEEMDYGIAVEAMLNRQRKQAVATANTT